MIAVDPGNPQILYTQTSPRRPVSHVRIRVAVGLAVHTDAQTGDITSVAVPSLTAFNPSTRGPCGEGGRSFHYTGRIVDYRQTVDLSPLPSASSCPR